jgi:putative ABC transport system ATP-binding protein
VALPLVLAEIAPAKRNQLVEQVLQQVGLTDRAHHLPAQLSGGQLQRVAIARAIVVQPELI